MADKPTFKVMLSSTYKELVEHRRAVNDALVGQGLLPIAMDFDAALPGHDLISASLAKVEVAEGYVGLISYRYGQTLEDDARNPEKLSLTELEFRRAVARGIPICMFIMHDDHPVPKSAVGAGRGSEEKLAAFLTLAKKGRIYAEFTSVDDLKAKAVQSLVELREELERRTKPKSLSEPATPQQAVSNIPIQVPLHFLGREGSMAEIDAGLKRKEGRVAITTLHGMRGVGKSTLAAAYALRHRADYRATWWIRAQTESTMRADLVALGVKLGWVAPDEKEEPALKAVMERLEHEGDGILLIFDNANNAKEISPYLPHGDGALVLVTSNDEVWGKIATKIEIEVWPPNDGAGYLIARTGRKNERDAALALSKALGGLPLAHEQAAAYCERLGVSLAEYQKRFEATPAKLLDDTKDAPAEYHDGLTVAKTFALAIDEAAKLHPAAEPLIVHCALLAPEPIPLFLFSEAREEFGEPLASALEGDGLDEAVAALRAFALLDRETIPDERDPSIATDCIRLHRLVRQVAAARCKDEARENMLSGLISALSAVYPKMIWRDPATWPRARRLDTLTLALVGAAVLPEKAERPAAKALIDAGQYRQSALASYAEARPLYERALAINERVLGPEHPGTAMSLNNLASLLRNQGELASARSLFERALMISEKVQGPEHPDTATSINSLAHLLQEQGDLAAARPLLERALAIREKVLGPEDAFTGTSLNNLANLLQVQGELTAARPLYERALAIQTKTHGSEHPNTNVTRGNLAALQLACGSPEAALQMAESALTAHDNVLGLAHPWTKISASRTADVLIALGRVNEATALRRKYGIEE